MQILPLILMVVALVLFVLAGVNAQAQGRWHLGWLGAAALTGALLAMRL